MTTEQARHQLMTADEYAALPDDGHWYELDEGRLIDVGGASSRSAVLATRLLVRLATFVEEIHAGLCGGADWGFLLRTDPDTVRVPDVAFVRMTRFPDGIVQEGFFPGAPDLAVEVLSPSNRFGETVKKVGEYLAAGTDLVWLIDPERRRVTVYDSSGNLTILGESGVLDGGEVVPGFRLDLTRLWLPT